MIIRTLLFVLLLSSVLVNSALALSYDAMRSEKRVALVIAQSNYDEHPITWAIKDGEAFAKTLKSFGFDVILVKNSELRQMVRAVRKFSRMIDGADVALFYFQGHALQYRNRNYLLPVDCSIEESYYINSSEVLEISKVIEAMKHRDRRVNIMVLDASKPDPLGDLYHPMKPGLAPMDMPESFYLLSSQHPNKALSQKFTKSFTKNLIDIMSQQGIEIRTLVRLLNKKNVLYYNFASKEKFYLNIPVKKK